MSFSSALQSLRKEAKVTQEELEQIQDTQLISGILLVTVTQQTICLIQEQAMYLVQLHQLM